MDGDAVREYIAYAAQLSSSGYYNKAFDLYVLAFEKKPELKALFEPEFRSAINKLNEHLAADGKIQEIFHNYGKAIKIFPDNVHFINDTGKYLYKYGYYCEAWCHFQKALKLDSGYVNAEKNLNSIKNLLLERWHYRMLNDKIRNEAYHEAIRETLIPYKDTVLDLGSGTGLLTLYCMECHPLAMTACDNSEQMTTMAECIMEDNNWMEVIIVNNMSTSMDFRDIGGKRSLLVTELFDAGLFGEHALESLAHAHEQLISNAGRIIPNKAEFFIIGAKCDHLAHKYYLNSAAKTLLNIPLQNIHIQTDNETYDCEDVYQFKGLKYMTQPQSLLKIDFNDYNDIQEKLNNTEPYDLELKAMENGDINTIIGWFNLYLTDNITVTTDPRSDQRANAWQQALFFDFVPQTVTESQTISLEFLLEGGKLSIVPSYNSNIIRVSPETLRFLNDTQYTKMITRCLGMASLYLGQMVEMSETSIVDLCPFPLFGFLMLKRGAKSLTCTAKTDDDRNFIENVFLSNKICLSKLNLLVGQGWSQDAFVGQKYHAIFCNVFEVCGDVDLRMYQIAQHLKNAHLLPGGLYMPASVSLMAQVVSSHWLDINNRVYDTNVNNYKIGKYINKYQVSQNFCIDFTCLEYTALTEPADLGKYGHVNSGVVNVPVIKDGEANAILCWYNIELMEDLGEIATNRGDSFIDGVVFLANPPIHMTRGGVANVLRCIDIDGAFKLMIDSETSS